MEMNKDFKGAPCPVGRMAYYFNVMVSTDAPEELLNEY
jgi:hypothetical protein